MPSGSASSQSPRPVARSASSMSACRCASGAPMRTLLAIEVANRCASWPASRTWTALVTSPSSGSSARRAGGRARSCPRRSAPISATRSPSASVEVDAVEDERAVAGAVPQAARAEVGRCAACAARRWRRLADRVLEPSLRRLDADRADRGLGERRDRLEGARGRAARARRARRARGRCWVATSRTPISVAPATSVPRPWASAAAAASRRAIADRSAEARSRRARRSGARPASASSGAASSASTSSSTSAARAAPWRRRPWRER